jgi:hypothetical protein
MMKSTAFARRISSRAIVVGRRLRRARVGGAANHKRANEKVKDEDTHHITPGMSWFSYAGSSMSCVM